MKAFAVGCFWFGGKKWSEHTAKEFSFNPEEHLNSIKRALESIENITDVKISSHEPICYTGAHIDPYDENYEYNFFPIYDGFVAQFGIYIPDRIQQQLAVFGSKTNSEYFDITIIYNVLTPVAFISYDTEDNSSRPSDAVQIIREYLKQKLSESTEDVVLKTLGPSPFHADFFLKQGNLSDNSNTKFKFYITDSLFRSYDECLIEYESSTADIDDIYFEFIFLMKDIISIYYESVLQRYNVMSANSKAVELLEKIIEIQKKSGILGAYKRLSTLSKNIRDLEIGLLEVEIAHLQSKNYLDKNISNKLPDHEALFIKYIKNELTNIDWLPVNRISEIIRLFEARQQKNVANISVLIAGLFGGLIGALATYLLGK